MIRIYYLLVCILVNSFVIGKRDYKIPKYLIKDEEIIVIFPKMRLKKRVLYELSELTTH